jgi:signal transduction histidine kinase
LLGTLLLGAQNSSNEQIKRIQRSIFIFNFAEQVTWEDQSNTSFTIGVLGPDRTFIDLKAQSLKRQIHNKPTQVVRFDKVKDVKNIQLLYVNKDYNFDIYYILIKIEGKEILLVTEDYNFNASMINIVNIGETFKYEINVNKIKSEGFTYNKSLEGNAISSSQKWKSLYKKTGENLIIEKENNKAQKEIIETKKEALESQLEKNKAQEETIDTITNHLKTQNLEIKKLNDFNEWQQKEYKEKIIIESELNKRIQAQLLTIENQEQRIDSSTLKIAEQEGYLKTQTEKIDFKEKVLESKDQEVNAYRRFNYLLILIAILLIIGGLLIYKNFLSKKKLNKVLEAQNIAIQEKSKEVAAKNKEIEQFVYIASHDLKEPLVTITGLINLFTEEYENALDDEAKEILGYIDDSSDRMKHLIEGLLEYSKLGKSKTLQLVDCNTLIQNLKLDLSNVIQRTNSKLIVGDLPKIQGLELELRLLFQNLISNGIKFKKSETTPIVEINCVKIPNVDNPLQGVHQFSIKDNGIGIEEKYFSRIFAIFQRLHSREEYEGTGIGLAHCKKIVTAHKGDIWLESKVGEGSTFYFTIPYTS